MTDADVYVRDHLLIEFMMDCYIENPPTIEELYSDWIRWLKKQEERNGKRSAV